MSQSTNSLKTAVKMKKGVKTQARVKHCNQEPKIDIDFLQEKRLGVFAFTCAKQKIVNTNIESSGNISICILTWLGALNCPPPPVDALKTVYCSVLIANTCTNHQTYSFSEFPDTVQLQFNLMNENCMRYEAKKSSANQEGQYWIII